MARNKASMAERMGVMGGQRLSLQDLPKVLGDGMPHLEFTQAGKLRLLSALRQRFGDGFMGLPHVKGVVDEFDSNAQHHVQMARMRNIRPGR